MTLSFCAAITRYSVSLLRFPFLSHVHVFSYEISLVCRWKYSYSCFSCHFCFLFIVRRLIIVVFGLFLVAVISISLLFCYVIFVVFGRCCYFAYFEYFTPGLIDGFPLESEWQQISWNHRNPSSNPGWSKKNAVV